MFLNFTNHHSARWGEAQLAAARVYGPVEDLPFPEVDPTADEHELDALAHLYVRRILAMAPAAVLCQGECTLAFRVVQQLLKQGITVLAAASRRQSEAFPGPDGSVCKRSVFAFVGFRRYGTPV